MSNCAVCKGELPDGEGCLISSEGIRAETEELFGLFNGELGSHGGTMCGHCNVASSPVLVSTRWAIRRWRKRQSDEHMPGLREE